jgi:hypothetical protein
VDRGIVKGMLGGLSGQRVTVTTSSKARGDDACAAVVWATTSITRRLLPCSRRLQRQSKSGLKAELPEIPHAYTPKALKYE